MLCRLFSFQSVGAKLCHKIQSELWRMICNLWRYGLGKALAWESTVPLSSHFAIFPQVQAPTHRATCFAAQVAFVLGASVVFSCSAKVETCHVLHPWTVMWRTAVQPLPPKNLRQFASRDLDGVFDGVWVSGFWLLPAAISLATFWCLLFKVSVGTNKRSRAFRCHNEAPTNSRNFKRSDWIKTGNHHATSWIIYMIIYNICIYIHIVCYFQSLWSGVYW